MLLEIINVSDQHIPQQMYEKIILNNSGMLQFIPNCCKTQKIYKKGVDYCPLDCYMTKETCNIMHVSNCYKTQQMCGKTEEPFTLQYCLDRYKIQEVCDKSADSCLLLLKFVLG